MKTRTFLLAPMAAALTIGSCFMPSAYADGKAMLGCSSPYQLATIVQIDAFSQPLVTEGYFTQDSLLALLNSLDHNGNGSLCYKVPPGWGGPPATNAANRSGFVNLVDDKVL